MIYWTILIVAFWIIVAIFLYDLGYRRGQLNERRKDWHKAYRRQKW